MRVYYEDTDAGGIVYHAAYLRYAERARTEALRDLGIPHAELVRMCNLMFVVRRVEVDYLRPARLDDSLVVATEVLWAGAASATLRQTVRSVADRAVPDRREAARDAAAHGVVAQAAVAQDGMTQGVADLAVANWGVADLDVASRGATGTDVTQRGRTGPHQSGVCAVLTVKLACVGLQAGPGGNRPGRLPPRWRTVLQAMRDARLAETATGAAYHGAGIGGSGGSSS